MKPQTLISVLIALLAVSCSARSAQATPVADPWLARDKALHAIAGAGVAAVALSLGASRPQAIAAGTVVGLLKEAHDSTGRGHVSARDAVVTALGAAALAYSPVPLTVWRSGRTTGLAVHWSF